MITNRNILEKGMLVNIIEKKGVEKRGYIEKIISKQPAKTGVKVKLTNGSEGRVHSIVYKDELKREQDYMLNKFFYEKIVYSIWDYKKNEFIQFKVNQDSYYFLYSDKKEAEKLLGQITGEDLTLNINQLNPNKAKFENLLNSNTYIVINGELRITFDKFKEKEIEYMNI